MQDSEGRVADMGCHNSLVEGLIQVDGNLKVVQFLQSPRLQSTNMGASDTCMQATLGRVQAAS